MHKNKPKLKARQAGRSSEQKSKGEIRVSEVNWVELLKLLLLTFSPGDIQTVCMIAEEDDDDQGTLFWAVQFTMQ